MRLQFLLLFLGILTFGWVLCVQAKRSSNSKDGQRSSAGNQKQTSNNRGMITQNGWGYNTSTKAQPSQIGWRYNNTSNANTQIRPTRIRNQESRPTPPTVQRYPIPVPPTPASRNNTNGHIGWVNATTTSTRRVYPSKVTTTTRPTYAPTKSYPTMPPAPAIGTHRYPSLVPPTPARRNNTSGRIGWVNATTTSTRRVYPSTQVTTTTRPTYPPTKSYPTMPPAPAIGTHRYPSPVPPTPARRNNTSGHIGWVNATTTSTRRVYPSTQVTTTTRPTYPPTKSYPTIPPAPVTSTPPRRDNTSGQITRTNTTTTSSGRVYPPGRGTTTTYPNPSYYPNNVPNPVISVPAPAPPVVIVVNTNPDHPKEKGFAEAFLESLEKNLSKPKTTTTTPKPRTTIARKKDTVVRVRPTKPPTPPPPPYPSTPLAPFPNEKTYVPAGPFGYYVCNSTPSSNQPYQYPQTIGNMQPNPPQNFGNHVTYPNGIVFNQSAQPVNSGFAPGLNPHNVYSGQQGTTTAHNLPIQTPSYGNGLSNNFLNPQAPALNNPYYSNSGPTTNGSFVNYPTGFTQQIPPGSNAQPGTQASNGPIVPNSLYNFQPQPQPQPPVQYNPAGFNYQPINNTQNIFPGQPVLPGANVPQNNINGFPPLSAIPAPYMYGPQGQLCIFAFYPYWISLVGNRPGIGLSAANQPGWPAANQPSWPAANQPGWPAANQPSWPAANQPSWPAANQPGWPAANQPGFPVANQPGFPAAYQPGANGVNIPGSGNPWQNPMSNNQPGTVNDWQNPMYSNNQPGTVNSWQNPMYTNNQPGVVNG